MRAAHPRITRHHHSHADGTDEDVEVERATSKRMRELLVHEPSLVVSSLLRLSNEIAHGAHLEPTHHHHSAPHARSVPGSRPVPQQPSGRGAMVVVDVNRAAPKMQESEVLNDGETRAYYHFVNSSGRCRRDCPELYGHLMKRVVILRHEDGDGGPGGDVK